MPNNASPAPVPLIMTRPRAASDAFVAALPETVRARLEPLFSPLIDICALEQKYELGPCDQAVFSSRNGVEFAPDGHGRTAYCIGLATTQAAIRNGWRAEQAGRDADSLVATLEAIGPSARILHLSGIHTRGDIAERLSKAGLNITNVPIYDQVLRTLTSEAQHVLETASRVLVPLFSPRTAAHFVASSGQLRNVHVIALSAAVAQQIPSNAVSFMDIARNPDAQAMSAALAEAIVKT